MKELKVTEKTGIFKNADVRAFIPEPGDKFSVDDEQGITKEAFMSILDKASQPIKETEAEPE